MNLVALERCLATVEAQLAAQHARQPVDDAWPRQRRPNQSPPPGDWRTWLFMAGRGSGKTRAGAEFVRTEIMAGRMGRVALVAPTAADARDVMIEGESGLLAVCERYACRPHYEPSKRRLTFPNGAKAWTYSADEPDRLRGPQHDGAWSDEIAAWKYPETWDMLQFGLRLGSNPRQIATSTPRPVKLMRELLAQQASGTVVVTRGTTYENRANLAPAFLDQIVRRYEGTRLGRQELEGHLLEDVPGALWTLGILDAHRRHEPIEPEALARIVVGVDPAASSGDEAAETGIIVAGVGHDQRGYVLADLSRRGSPLEWAQATVRAFDHWRADRVIAEANNGGEMVRQTLQTVRASLPVRLVHASRGKLTRAEPVAALYEQGRVSHVGAFPELEDQMTTYAGGGDSPDRLDALVWALTDLVIGAPAELAAPIAVPGNALFSASGHRDSFRLDDAWDGGGYGASYDDPWRER